MKNQKMIGSLLLTLLFAFTLTASAKTDFSGRWVLDKSKSTGLPEGMDQRMAVEQSGDTIEIETDLFQGDNVNTIPDKYMLDGKEMQYATQLPSGEKTMAKRVAKWNEKGDGFEVNDVAVYDTANGKVTITTTRKWQSTEDGKSVTIELVRTAPTGTTSSKRTFNRK